MRLGDFRKHTKDLSDDTFIMYHAYDKGCCHSPYSDGWNYIDNTHKCIVMNPGEDYDERIPEDNKDGGLNEFI